MLETQIQTLFRIGWYRVAPLVMDRRRETTGVFPTNSRCGQNNSHWGGGITGPWLENPEDAHKEFERYRAAPTAVDIDKDTLERLFPKGHVNKLGTHYQGVARKAQVAPCRGYETFQRKRTSGSARASRSCLGRATLWQMGRNCFQELLLWVSRQKQLFRHVRLFRCILSCFDAPRRTQEWFGRGSAFPFWIRSKRCAHVSCGFWFDRCTTHVVPNRGCSWKVCASNVDGRPLVGPCSRPNQHIQGVSLE